MNKVISSFPIQKLPESKKTEEWHKQCIDYVIGAGDLSRNGSDRATLEEMQSYYDLYNGIYNLKDLKYLLNINLRKLSECQLLS